MTPEEWKPSADVPDVSRARKRQPRSTEMMSRRSQLVSAAQAALLAILLQVPVWIQSCSARDVAESAERKADEVAPAVPTIEAKAKQTGHELDASYKAIADNLGRLEQKLKYIDERQSKLEGLIVKISPHPAAKRYRPPRPPPEASKPVILPPNPASAAAEQDIRIHQER